MCSRKFNRRFKRAIFLRHPFFPESHLTSNSREFFYILTQERAQEGTKFVQIIFEIIMSCENE